MSNTAARELSLEDDEAAGEAGASEAIVVYR